MANRIKKYNPAFLTPEELVRSFVVRHTELDLIMQVIKENVNQSNQHIIVIGPRGIGKTMLVLRVIEKIREEEDLRERWYPVVFGEESYQVSTPGEFWLEALFHLAHKTGDEQWGQTFEELRDEPNDERLSERALAQLMDFADAVGKRILLVVENFNMLLGEQIDDSDAWKLRHTLLNEPRVMLLATATSRFEEIENADKAMFELFKLYELKVLDERECGTLWASITEKEATEERVRPLQILTGGNPRLLAIISTFAAKMSLKELMDDLMQLVDDNTEYFKSHLDSLPAIERKVYLALAELWDPATARKVADSARLNVNKASSLLRRLMKRGMVVEADGERRAKLYQVAERMYNIYYLMRRRGAPSRRVRGLVRFMVPFYGPKELVGLTRRIVEEACKLGPELRKDHLWVYEGILERTQSESLRQRLIEVAPRDFFEMADIPDSLKGLADKRLLALLREADDLSEKPDQLKEAERIYREVIEINPQKPAPWAKLGQLLHEKLCRYEDAEEAYRKAIELDTEYAWAWWQLGELLHAYLERNEEAEKVYRKFIELKPGLSLGWISLGRLHEDLECYEKAEEAYSKALELDPKEAVGWMYFGTFLKTRLERYEEAEKAYRKAIGLKPDEARIWAQLGLLLHEKLERYEEAERAYRKAIEIDEKYAWAWAQFGLLLHKKLERYEEAEGAYRKAIEIDEKYAWAWAQLGLLLHDKLERYEEAEGAYRKVIEIDEKNAWAWAQLGLLLHDKLERYEEAEGAYRKVIEIDEKNVWAWAQLGLLLHDKLERYEEAEGAYRKAVEIDEKYAWAWAQLAELLHKKLKRYEEAEKAYRKAIELEPEVAWGYAQIGRLLQGKFERYEDAEEAYRKAIEIEPDYAWAWTHLGLLLHMDLDRPDEAEKAYRKAIEIDPKYPCPWVYIGKLLQERKCYEEAEKTYRKALEKGVDCSYAWTELGRLLDESLGRHEEAEEAYRKAMELEPKTLSPLKNLIALLQEKLERPSEALELVRNYLKETDLVEENVNDAIDLFVGLAAAGYAGEALDILRDSPSAKILEPLVAGLRMYVGEDVKAAAEIMEVGKDVVKRIEERRKKIQAEPDSEERPRAKAGR